MAEKNWKNRKAISDDMIEKFETFFNRAETSIVSANRTKKNQSMLWWKRGMRFINQVIYVTGLG